MSISSQLLLPAPISHTPQAFAGIIGVSDAMRYVFAKTAMYAISDAAVLVTGETGVGKELIANAIHKLSRRSNKPFVSMKCSAITDSLFESELFGHEKGAFTGALRSRKGRFERADGGTLFLDEVGDLPPDSQAKLLRAIETSEIERVGAEKPIKVDVRLVSATNKNLELEASRQGFRLDLFYRLNPLQIHIPPLRQRQDDIEPLIAHFIGILNKKYSRNVIRLTNEAITLLKTYQWPGNVRELRNLMERLFAENKTEVIGIKALQEWYEERLRAHEAIQQAAAASERHFSPNLPVYKETIITPDRTPILLGDSTTNADSSELSPETLKAAFSKARGNITKASELLGIHKSTFYRAMKTNKLTRKDLEA